LPLPGGFDIHGLNGVFQGIPRGYTFRIIDPHQGYHYAPGYRGEELMIVYIYRWKIKTDKEAQFIEGWEFITRELREKCGSLGSRLHKGDDGLYYGYAQWPDRESREKAQITGPEVTRARMLLKDAVEQAFPDVELTPIADYLMFPAASH
jgi:quinol monooxygenase YgiN